MPPTETPSNSSRCPIIHRGIKERVAFRFPTLEYNDYRIVQVNNTMHVLSKLDDEHFELPRIGTPLYPRRNGHSRAENHPLNQHALFQHQEKVISG